MKIASTSLPVLNGLRAIYIGLMVAEFTRYMVNRLRSFRKSTARKAQELIDIRLYRGRRVNVVPVPLFSSAVGSVYGAL